LSLVGAIYKPGEQYILLRSLLFNKITVITTEFSFDVANAFSNNSKWKTKIQTAVKINKSHLF